MTKNGSTAYLKALDFSAAFNSSDVARELQALAEAYNFERDLCYRCKARHLDKIVYPISDGSVDVPGFPAYVGKVYYIIFELSDGDIRSVKDTFAKLNLAFVLRSLHNVAVGIQQLHSLGVAHQDLKPSNVLVFQKEVKISDLGRASDSQHPFKFDDFVMPGDRNYAPIEQWYGYHFSNDFNERFAYDLYLFGSLFLFFFAGLSMSQSLFNQLKISGAHSTGDFKADLSDLNSAFSEVITDFSKTVTVHLRDEVEVQRLVNLVIWLCQPDPEKRGHPKNLSTPGNQRSLERIITQLSILAKKAELELL